MSSIKDIVKNICLGTSIEECTDSLVSRLHLLRQIEARWGKEVAENTDLEKDVKNFTRWSFEGYRIKSMEKSLQGIRLVPPKNEGTNRTIRKPRVVHLFHRRQVH